jgi:hypothetical protein
MPLRPAAIRGTTIEPSGRFVPWLTTVKKSAVNQIF